MSNRRPLVSKERMVSVRDSAEAAAHPHDSTETDEIALEQKRVRGRERLSTIRPEWSTDQWLQAAREQLVFWIRRHVAQAEFPARFAHIMRLPHGLSMREVFAAFFCFEDQSSDVYYEIPFLMAVAEGDVGAVRAAAEVLGIDPDTLSAELLNGPFLPVQSGNRVPHTR